jgi:ubiquinone biosynthesis protein UbiJ
MASRYKAQRDKQVAIRETTVGVAGDGSVRIEVAGETLFLTEDNAAELYSIFGEVFEWWTGKEDD